MKSIQRSFKHSTVLFILLFAAIGYTPPQADAQGDIILEPAPIVSPVTNLTINDIDFLNSTTPKWLFTISMRTQGIVQAEMEIEVEIRLPGNETVLNAIYMKTEPFEINFSKTITNLDLKKTVPVATYNFSQEARRLIEQTALPGGAIPAGLYTFLVRVTPVGGGSSGEGTFTLNPSNPSSVELLTPLDGDQFVNTFPLFQWLYEGARARISIFEQLPGQSSLEETASGVPHLTATLETRSFQYPGGGVRALQPGKTYVWFVEGLATASGNTQIQSKSEFRSFTVASEASSSALTLLELLERALGQKYRVVFDQIRAEGLTSLGSIRLNGSTISNAELSTYINRIRASLSLVRSVELQ